MRACRAVFHEKKISQAQRCQANIFLRKLFLGANELVLVCSRANLTCKTLFLLFIFTLAREENNGGEIIPSFIHNSFFESQSLKSEEERKNVCTPKKSSPQSIFLKSRTFSPPPNALLRDPAFKITVSKIELLFFKKIPLRRKIST